MAKKQPLTDEQRAKARERARRYNAKPDVIEARKAYYRRPEVQARYEERNGSEDWKAYCKQYRQTERGRDILKDSGLRQRGFTLELWNTLTKLQGNACAICRRPFDSLGYRNLHADHCHEEMRPRGLLCRNCNHAEGQIKKTGLAPEEYARRLALYLLDPPASAAVVHVSHESVGAADSKELL